MEPRVLILTTSFPRFRDDEASLFIGKLVEGLSESGTHGVVITPFDSEERPRECWGNFEIFRFRYGIWRRGRLAFGRGILPNLRSNPLLALQIPLFLMLFVVHGYLRRERFDVIHAQWLISLLPACFLGALTRKPYLVTVRGEDMRLLQIPILAFVLKYIMKKASAVTVVSRSAGRQIEQALGGFPTIEVIHNGVGFADATPGDQQRFQSDCSTHDVKPGYLLFVGRIIDVKRVHLLPQLLKHNAFHNKQLVIIGRFNDRDPSYAELSRAVAASGAADRIKILGPRSPQQVQLYLRHAGCYVSASEREGRPNAVLEAGASGVPLLLSDIEAHRDIVESTGAGSLFTVVDERIELGSLNIPNARIAASFPARTWRSCAEDYKAVYSVIS
jgi:glycosyltransferase involved in cell wall biosynthesis